jgi:hypothetical protein
MKMGALRGHQRILQGGRDNAETSLSCQAIIGTQPGRVFWKKHSHEACACQDLFRGTATRKVPTGY